MGKASRRESFYESPWQVQHSVGLLRYCQPYSLWPRVQTLVGFGYLPLRASRILVWLPLLCGTTLIILRDAQDIITNSSRVILETECAVAQTQAGYNQFRGTLAPLFWRGFKKQIIKMFVSKALSTSSEFFRLKAVYVESGWRSLKAA